MSDDYVPEHLQHALSDFENALAETRTKRHRLEKVEIPDVAGPTAAEMAEAAARPDAPRELKAVARAVDEGRASWDDVLEGRPGAAPEVRALYEASEPRFAAFWERGQQEDRLRAEAARKPDD